MGAPESARVILVEDEDAAGGDRGGTPIVRDLYFAGKSMGKIAMSPVQNGGREEALMDLVGRESPSRFE